MIRVLLAVLLIVGLTAGALVGAANAAAPGDALYGLDREIETIRRDLTHSSESIVRLQVAAAQERLAEVNSLLQHGDQAHLDEALAGLDQALEGMEQTANSTRGKTAQAVSNTLDEAFPLQVTPAPKESKDDQDQATYCNNLDGPQHPAGARLAQRYGVSYQDIMGWFCEGYGFGEINLAYQLSQRPNSPTVAELFAMRQQGLGWGEIMQTAGVIKATQETETPESEDQAKQRSNEACSSSNINPHAQKLAQAYDVPVTQVMDYFCKGYGFGEIKLAYNISRATGVQVADIFTQRASGLGWGQIMQSYNLIGNSKSNQEPENGAADEANNGQAEDQPGSPAKGPKDKPGKSFKPGKPVK